MKNISDIVGVLSVGLYRTISLTALLYSEASCRYREGFEYIFGTNCTPLKNTPSHRTERGTDLAIQFSSVFLRHPTYLKLC